MILLEEHKKTINAVAVFLLFFFSFLVIGVLFFAIRVSSNNIFLASLATNGFDASQLMVKQDDVASAAELPSPSATPPVILGQSAISIELKNGQDNVLFSKDENKILPIASLTKIMTALVVFEQYDLNQKVVIGESAMSQEGEQGNLKLGEVLSVKDLLYITLIESSNRSAKALSEVVGTDQFVVLMNQEAARLGLSNTHFEDSTGLSQGSYSTAKDVAKLSEYVFLHYPLFSQIVGLRNFDLYVDGKLHHILWTTDEILGERGIIGGKTGWTNEARGCFMVIQKVNDRYFIHILLGSEDRFGEMEKLLIR